MDWLFTLIGALIAGLIIGPLARLVMPGKQDISVFGTIVSGAIGALVGGAAANWLGVGDTRGIDWIQLILEVAAAAVAVTGYMAIVGGRRSDR